MKNVEDLNHYAIQKERAKIGKHIYELGLKLLPDEDIFERNNAAIEKMNIGWIGNDEIFICLTLHLSGEYDE